MLEHTKSSGPVKALTVLPVFVSQDAYVRKPWLDVGLMLWAEGPLSYPRDYFLPLPSDDFQGCLQARALYSDSAGFSRSLLATLRRPDGRALLSPSACRFWTEFSDRAGLDGWCMALGVSVSERSFLGRLAAKGSTDAYVRTAVRIVENLQLLAARHGRASAQGGPDFYDEEHILRRLHRFLLSAEGGEEWVTEGISTFSLPNFSLHPRPLEDVRTAATAAAEVQSPMVLANSGAEGENDGDDDDDDDDAPPDLSDEMPVQELDLAEVKLAAKAVAEAVPDLPHGFVIIKTKGGQVQAVPLCGGVSSDPGHPLQSA